MNAILPVILVVLSLLYSVQGGALCVKVSGTNSSANSFCGCQLMDSANHTVINITLDTVKKPYARPSILNNCNFHFNNCRKVYHDLVSEYTYSPCSSNSDCGDGKAAVRSNLLIS